MSAETFVDIGVAATVQRARLLLEVMGILPPREPDISSAASVRRYLNQVDRRIIDRCKQSGDRDLKSVAADWVLAASCMGPIWSSELLKTREMPEVTSAQVEKLHKKVQWYLHLGERLSPVTAEAHSHAKELGQLFRCMRVIWEETSGVKYRLKQHSPYEYSLVLVSTRWDKNKHKDATVVTTSPATTPKRKK